MLLCFFLFKQKTAYEMRISDWSSDVCSSDLRRHGTVEIMLCHKGRQDISRAIIERMCGKERLVAQMTTAPYHGQVYTNPTTRRGDGNDIDVIIADRKSVV